MRRISKAYWALIVAFLCLGVGRGWFAPGLEQTALAHSVQDGPGLVEPYDITIKGPILFYVTVGDITIVVTEDEVVVLDGTLGESCLAVAMAACGEGQICSVRIRRAPDGTESCEFTCRDGEGHCPTLRD